MFKARTAQVAQNLGEMFVGEAPRRLDLNDQFSVHEYVVEVVSKHMSVRVPDLQRKLGDGLKPGPLQPMYQSVLVDFLQVPVPQVAVKREGGFANLIAQRKHVLPGHGSSVFRAQPCARRHFAHQGAYPIQG